MENESRDVLERNRQRGVSDWGGRRYDFVCPSPASYPFQWFWDSAFHAIALLHLDPERAKQEIRCLLQAAQPDGFIPHMILWERRFHQAALEQYSIVLAHPFYTATIQPPVLARALYRIFLATGDLDFIREALPPTLRFFDWLSRVRDPRGDGLIAIIQPDESGLDASPKYDQLMGFDQLPASEIELELPRAMQRLFLAYAPYRDDPNRLLELDAFNWVDVMVNSIYVDGLFRLAQLCRVASPAAGTAERLERRARQSLSALMERCWDERVGVFWDLKGLPREPVRILTFSALVPLIIPELDRSVVDRLVQEHLLNEREFWLPYPVPSVAATETSFDPDFRTRAIWRGPTWVNVNWYLVHGLRQHGYTDIADELARRTQAMVQRGGMREFFNPFTAEGYGATNFGWTTLVEDLLDAPKV